MLVEEGLCAVLPQAERLTFGRSLFDAEEKAKEAKKNIWEVSSVDSSPFLAFQCYMIDAESERRVVCDLDM